MFLYSLYWVIFNGNGIAVLRIFFPVISLLNCFEVFLNSFYPEYGVFMIDDLSLVKILKNNKSQLFWTKINVAVYLKPTNEQLQVL